MEERVRNAFLSADVGSVRYDEPLRSHCTWRIGGPADVWVVPTSVLHLQNLQRLVTAYQVPRIVIGRGSNLLCDDSGFRGVVIMIGHSISEVRIARSMVLAQAGIAVSRLARIACIAGLAGIEHVVGIPGTLGGLLVMNGGSMRRSVGDVVRSVRCVDETGELIGVTSDQCAFGYRSSVFQSGKTIIAEVCLSLTPGDYLGISQEMLRILRLRRQKFPMRIPSCGSVFKSDPVLYERWGSPGKVIEELGGKGWRIGGAEVSYKHANFIVNRGGARCSEVLSLIREIRELVHKKTGIWLACEVRYVAPDGVSAPADELL